MKSEAQSDFLAPISSRGGTNDYGASENMNWLVTLLLLGTFTAACSSSSSSGTTTGGGCTDNASCNGRVCVISPDFPSGYCSQGCQLSNPSSCPNGTVCIDDASGVPADAGITAVCYQSCALSSDCTRAGYACLEKASHLVCRNGK